MAKWAKRQLRGKAVAKAVAKTAAETTAAIKDKEGDIWDKKALDVLFNKTI